MRILVADDDVFVHEMIETLLKDTGLASVNAADGLQAIAEFEKQPFRIAVIDMMMPNRDGIQTIRDIRRRWPATRIIAMSGGSKLLRRFQVLDWAAELGADAVLPKPFTPQALVEVVEAQLRLAPPPAVAV